MAINSGRVLAGGLAAGVVMNVIDILTNGFWLAKQWDAEASVLNPRLVDPAGVPVSMAGWIATDLLYGLLIVLAYAAIRPRFGPGAATAMKAGVFVWFVSHVAYAMLAFTNLFSADVVIKSAVGGLIAALAGAYVGGMIYKEQDAPAGRRAAV